MPACYSFLPFLAPRVCYLWDERPQDPLLGWLGAGTLHGDAHVCVWTGSFLPSLSGSGRKLGSSALLLRFKDLALRQLLLAQPCLHSSLVSQGLPASDLRKRQVAVDRKGSRVSAFLCRSSKFNVASPDVCTNSTRNRRTARHWSYGQNPSWRSIRDVEATRQHQPSTGRQRRQERAAG